MSLSHATRLLASTVGALAVTAGLVIAPAHAAPAKTTAPVDSVAALTDRIAALLAGEFADEARRSGLLSATSTDPVRLARAAEGTALGQAVRDADREVLAAKGLPQDGTSLLTVRLAHADMVAALRRGTAPLVASSPSDDTPTTVTAYDHTGRRIALAADRVPLRPVYLVEVDTTTALAKGTQVLRSTLSQRGLSPASARAAVTPAAGYWATQLTSIHLDDDHEPWHKGDSEIFTITAGFGLDGKVKVRARESIVWTKELLQKEGIFSGISAGAVIWVAQRVAEKLAGEGGGDVVCLLPDGGWKYMSTEAWTQDIDTAEEQVEAVLWW